MWVGNPLRFHTGYLFGWIRTGDMAGMVTKWLDTEVRAAPFLTFNLYCDEVVELICKVFELL